MLNMLRFLNLNILITSTIVVVIIIKKGSSECVCNTVVVKKSLQLLNTCIHRSGNDVCNMDHTVWNGDVDGAKVAIVLTPDEKTLGHLKERSWAS